MVAGAGTAAAVAMTTTTSRQSFISLLKSSDIRWAMGGWSFFIAENAILSENRTWLIEDVLNGDHEQYHMIYGTFSTIATASIGYAYYRLRKNAALVVVTTTTNIIPKRLPFLPYTASWMAASMGFIMASQALPKFQIPIEMVSSATTTTTSIETTTPSTDSSWKFKVRCPFDFQDPRHNNNNNNSTTTSVISSTDIYGLERISRHPGLWSLAFVGISNVFWQPTIPLKIWMMGPTFVAWLGGQHHDSRFQRGIGGTIDNIYVSQTSNIPFVALLSGRQGNVLDTITNLITNEMKGLNAVLATSVATVWILSKGRSRKLPSIMKK